MRREYKVTGEFGIYPFVIVCWMEFKDFMNHFSSTGTTYSSTNEPHR